MFLFDLLCFLSPQQIISFGFLPSCHPAMLDFGSQAGWEKNKAVENLLGGM